MLALYGEYDALVEPKGNIPLLEKGLAAGGNTRCTIVIVPGGSHGFVRKNGICPQEFKDVPQPGPGILRGAGHLGPF